MGSLNGFWPFGQGPTDPSYVEQDLEQGAGAPQSSHSGEGYAGERVGAGEHEPRLGALLFRAEGCSGKPRQKKPEPGEDCRKEEGNVQSDADMFLGVGAGGEDSTFLT